MDTTVSTQPVNYRSGSSWLPIDDSLVPGPVAGTLTERANSFRLTLPTTLGASPVSLQNGGESVSFTPLSSTAVTAAVGSAAVFAHAYSGVTARYSPLPTGIRETLTLASASATATFRYRLGTSAGLTFGLTDSGDVAVRAADGRRAFTIAAPTVTDAAGVSGAASFSLAADILTLSVDPQWLRSSSRVFPVTVDPDTYTGSGLFCGISQSSSSCTSDLALGTDAAGTHDNHRALLKFDFSDTGIPADASVLTARVNLWLKSDTSSDEPHPILVDAYQANKAFTSAVTWTKYDGTNSWTSAGGDFPTRRESQTTVEPSYVPGWLNFGVPRLAQGWLDGTIPNNGVLFRVDDETRQDVIAFGGSTYAESPNLDVVWEPRYGHCPGCTLDSYRIDDRSTLGVNVANGHLDYSANDVHVNGTGLDLGVTRSYHNDEPDGGGELASAGWSFNGGPDIKLISNHWDGSMYIAWTDGMITRFDRNPDNTFTQAAGLAAHLLDNGDNTFTLRFDRSGVKYQFDSFNPHYLTDIVDANGNDLHFTYGASGWVKETDTHGHDLSVTYSSGGDHITDLKDYGSPARDWQYGVTTPTGLGYEQLTSYTDPNAKTTTYHYNTSTGNLDTITDGRGHQTTIHYDTTNDRVSQISRQIDATHWATTTYAYSVPTTTSTCKTTDYTAGQNLMVQTVVTDPDGHATTYCSNTDDQVIAAFNALGERTSTTYTPNGDASKFESLPGGTGTTSAPTTLSFTAATSSDPTADVTNNLTDTQGPDPFGAALGEKTHNDFYAKSDDLTDPREQYLPKDSSDSSGQSLFFSYQTGTGNLTKIGDSATSPANVANLAYQSSGDGNLRTATDGNGHVTTFGEDASHNITSITPPGDPNPGWPGAAMGPTTITYDTYNRVHTVTDGRGTVATYTYDPDDRVTRIDYSDSSYFAFGYDADGNVTSRADSAAHSSSYVYDDINRRTSETVPGGTTNYGYDVAGNLTSLGDSTGTVNYQYEALNRVKKITLQDGSTAINYAYTDTFTFGQTSSVQTFPGGVTQTVHYDLEGKPLNIKVANGATTLSNLTYTYGLSTGTCTAPATLSTEVIQTATDSSGNVTTYCYSAVGQLKEAKTKTSGGTVTKDIVYTYDKAFNRIQMDVTTAGTTHTYYGYNNDSELCWQGATAGTVTSGQSLCTPKPTGDATYFYDADGNQIRSGATCSNAYSIRNALTNVCGTTLSQLSPGNGELSAVGTATQTENLLGVGQITSGGTTTSYIRDPGGAAVAQTNSAGKQYYLSDAIGSTTGLLSGTSIARSYTYDPDGNATTTGSGAAAPFTFAGGQNVNGLLHFAARYYDPAQARWTQGDPLQQPGDLTQANRYAYAGDNPASEVDPSGRFSLGFHVDIQAGPIHISGGVSADTNGHVGVSAGLGGGDGDGFSAGIEGTYSNHNVESGNQIEGGGCVGPGVASCLSGSSKGDLSAGAGVGAGAGISDEQTWKLF